MIYFAPDLEKGSSCNLAKDRNLSKWVKLFPKPWFLAVIKPSDQSIKESKSWSVFLPHFLSHMREEQEKLWESLRVHPSGAGMCEPHMVWEGSKPFCILRLGEGQPHLSPALCLLQIHKNSPHNPPARITVPSLQTITKWTEKKCSQSELNVSKNPAQS